MLRNMLFLTATMEFKNLELRTVIWFHGIKQHTFGLRVNVSQISGHLMVFLEFGIITGFDLFQRICTLTFVMQHQIVGVQMNPARCRFACENNCFGDR